MEAHLLFSLGVNWAAYLEAHVLKTEIHLIHANLVLATFLGPIGLLGPWCTYHNHHHRLPARARGGRLR